MTKKEFNEVIEELKELCFEIEAGEYYCDKCLEFDDVLEVLNKKIKRKWITSFKEERRKVKVTKIIEGMNVLEQTPIKDYTTLSDILTGLGICIVIIATIIFYIKTKI